MHTEPYPAPTVLYFGHADFKFVPTNDTNDVKYAAIMRMKSANGMSFIFAPMKGINHTFKPVSA